MTQSETTAGSATPVDPQVAEAEQVIERHASRNFWLNVLDGGAFFMGLSMVSRFTVLPLFVERMGGERWMQGLIPTIVYTGWFLPGIFMAPIVMNRPRRKPLLLAITIGERLPFLLIGLLLFFVPQAAPPWLLGLFFLLYIIHAFSGGMAAIPWQDFIGRVIPKRRWGTFFGIQSGVGGLLGAGGAAIATVILATQPFPQSVGLLALICFGLMVISFVFLAATVEPAMPPPPRQSIRQFLSGVIPLLNRDAHFRAYLFARAAIALGFVGHSFLTAAALERFNLPNSEIGVFTGALLIAQALGDLGLGALADHWGHKQVLELSTVIGAVAILLAVVAPAPAWFILIFVLVGVAQAGYTLSGFTLVMSFAGDADRPTYIGVSNTALAPVSIFGPLMIGALAEFAGYEAMFALLILIGLGGLFSLHRHVVAPKAAHHKA